MLPIIKRYQTLLTFTVLVGCSGAYVACGSDDEVTPGPGKGGTGGVGGGGTGGGGTGGGGTGGGGTGGGGTGGGGTGGTGGMDAPDDVESNGDAMSDAMDDV